GAGRTTPDAAAPRQPLSGSDPPRARTIVKPGAGIQLVEQPVDLSGGLGHVPCNLAAIQRSDQGRTLGLILGIPQLGRKADGGLPNSCRKARAKLAGSV